MRITNASIFNLFDKTKVDKVTGERISIVDIFSKVNLTAMQSYKRMRNLKVLLDIYKDILDTRNDLIKKYGKEDENGNYSIAMDDKENMQKFIDEFNGVLDVEEEISINKFELSELEGRMDFDDNDVFVGLAFMFNLPDEEEKPKEIKKPKAKKKDLKPKEEKSK